jgi:hypothetical protein
VRLVSVRVDIQPSAPNLVPVEPEEFQRYARHVVREAFRYRIDLREAAITDDDDRWDEKVEPLFTEAVPFVRFTFGIPDAYDHRGSAPPGHSGTLASDRIPDRAAGLIRVAVPSPLVAAVGLATRARWPRL